MRIDEARRVKAQLWDELVRTLPVVARAGGPVTLALGLCPAGTAGYGLAIRFAGDDRPAAGLAAEVVERGRRLSGVACDVREIGVVRPHPWTPDTLQSRQRPLRPGLSVAHPAVTAGTIGGFVRDRGDGGLWILSNNHVLANSDRGAIGDPIVQPGPVDGGREPADVVGSLCRVVALREGTPNLVDAAAAVLADGVDAVPDHPAGSLAGWADPDVGLAVEKVGRTTGLTEGRVTAIEIDGLMVNFPGGVRTFDGQLEVAGAGPGPFSAGGDSGSVVYRPDTLQAIGLLFAGSERGGPGGLGLTYCNPIGAVLDALDVDLASSELTEPEPVAEPVERDRAAAAKEELSARLRDDPRVTGVGLTMARSGYAVRVNVVDPADRPDVPSRVAGVDVVVVAVGHVVARRSLAAEPVATGSVVGDDRRVSEPFDAVDVIRAKRDRTELSPEQIDWVVDAYTRGVVADEQMSALAMAILLNGMNQAEISRWTGAMVASGARMDWSDVGRPTTDKHSTGGVGDKITLPLAPAVAACGAAVPQLSGRGLGHTGGTLDKLEAIPGWRAALSGQEMLEQLRGVGAVVCAATTDLAPADRKLYALRDVTGTVEAIPLIASSIMGKKIAEGTGALVLDVKVGSGAFMKDVESARELAQTMVALGTDAGVRTVALLTNMQTPLGLTAGNALEVREAVEVLAGGGPEDVVELTVALGREMLAAAGLEGGKDPADALADGSAMDMWRAMIRAQGGDPDAPLPVASEQHTVLAPATGVLARLDALAVGVAAWRLGAGRARKEDPVQAGAGVEIHAKPGAVVRAGEPLLTLHTDEPSRFDRALEALEDGYVIVPAGGRPDLLPLIIERIA